MEFSYRKSLRMCLKIARPQILKDLPYGFFIPQILKALPCGIFISQILKDLAYQIPIPQILKALRPSVGGRWPDQISGISIWIGFVSELGIPCMAEMSKP